MNEIIKPATAGSVADKLSERRNPEPPIDDYFEAMNQLGRSVFCDKCKKLASRIEIDSYIYEDKVKFLVMCHGDSERCEMKYDDLKEIIRNRGVALVFNAKQDTQSKSLECSPNLLEETNKKE